MPASPFLQRDEGAPVDISIASLPCDAGSVPGLLNDISSLGSKRDLSADRNARLDLLEKARYLVRALETPRETMLKHVGAQPLAFICIALGIDVGLFDLMAKNDGSAKTVQELASQLEFDLDPLRRILRHLVAMGYIIQTDVDEFKPNNFSKALTIPLVNAGYPFYRSVCLVPMLRLDQWMKKNDYKAPSRPRDSAFTLGNQTDMTLFEYVAAKPPFGAIFNNHMGGYRLGRPSWVDPAVYPARANLIDGFVPSSPSAALLVDVGGSVGHDLELFLRAFPDAPPAGRLVLQDRPAVVAAIPADGLDGRVERMAHDFFAEQPVRGARAYYLHSVLHDWPDDRCVEIVGRIVEVMEPGYSRLVVNEHVIPPVGASWEATFADIYMMGLFGSRERTEGDWRELLEGRCGLKIRGIWNPGNGVEGVIECEVA